MSAVHLKIFGRVQGVFYRQSALEKARSLKLVGFVRNCEDGAVELVAEGDPPELEAMIAWCRKGPPSAIVERIEVKHIKPEGLFRDFRTEYT